MQNITTNSTTQSIYSASQTIEQAIRYLNQGFAPVPVKYREKAPTLPKWQETMLSEYDLPRHFRSEAHNIGIHLGARSNGLVDIDI